MNFPAKTIIFCKSPTFAWLLGVFPVVLVGWHIGTGQLGPDPAKELVNELGSWAIRWLLLTLTMTPLRWWTQQGFWTQWRRPLGVTAFFYSVLHLLAYIVFMLGADWGHLGEEIRKRPYILVGFTAFLLLLPLALTSTKASQRRLKRRWLAIHQLIYPAAALALLHGSWVQKLSIAGFWPYLLVGLLLGLLRIFKKLQRFCH